MIHALKIIPSTTNDGETTYVVAVQAKHEVTKSIEQTDLAAFRTLEDAEQHKLLIELVFDAITSIIPSPADFYTQISNKLGEIYWSRL